MFPPGGERELPVVDVDATRVTEHGDAIPRMLHGSLAGILVRGAIEPSRAAELVRCLQSDGGSLPTFRPPVFKGHVFGMPLVSASDGLSTYLDDAARFRAGCTAICSDYPRIEQRIGELLSALAQKLTVRVPCGPDGRSYLPDTIRVLIEGDRLPLHYENETLRSPVMTALRPELDLSTLMSFYMPLAVPPSGGLLRLFWTHCLDGGDTLVESFGGEERARPQFEARGYATVLPAVGDLLVFDGGRWYHDVTPIVGGQRWTLGGFLAATRDGRTVYYWS